MKLFKFYNTKALGKNPEYCISASVLAQTEQRARRILSEDYEDERFLNEKICKLDEEIDLFEEKIIDWESDS
jgi:hypothetical protein